MTNVTMTKRSIALGLFIALGCSVTGGAAHAHGDLLSSRPADGSTIRKPPEHVALHLAEEPAKRSVVTVTDGCARDVTGDIYAADQTLHALVAKKAQPGDWQVTYRVVSAEDGHLSKGGYTFTVKGNADCSAETTGNEEGQEDEVAQGGGAPVGAPAPVGREFPIVAALIGGAIVVALAFAVRVASARK